MTAKPNTHRYRRKKSEYHSPPQVINLAQWANACKSSEPWLTLEGEQQIKF